MGNRPKRAESVLIDGTRVRDLRERAGLTQELLAAEVTNLGWHLSQGYLPSLEKKPTARVHKQLATTLATALGMPVTGLRAAVSRERNSKESSGQRMAGLRGTGGQQNAPLLTGKEREQEEVVPLQGLTVGQEIGRQIDSVLSAMPEIAIKSIAPRIREALLGVLNVFRGIIEYQMPQEPKTSFGTAAHIAPSENEKVNHPQRTTVDSPSPSVMVQRIEKFIEHLAPGSSEHVVTGDIMQN